MTYGDGMQVVVIRLVEGGGGGGGGNMPSHQSNDFTPTKIILILIQGCIDKYIVTSSGTCTPSCTDIAIALTL